MSSSNDWYTRWGRCFTCKAGLMVLAVVVVAPDTMPSASPASTMRVPYTLMSVKLSLACCSVSPFFFLASHSNGTYLPTAFYRSRVTAFTCMICFPTSCRLGSSFIWLELTDQHCEGNNSLVVDIETISLKCHQQHQWFRDSELDQQHECHQPTM